MHVEGGVVDLISSPLLAEVQSGRLSLKTINGLIVVLVACGYALLTAPLETTLYGYRYITRIAAKDID